MSAPSVVIGFDKDGNETGRVFHNWGFVSPSAKEVGFRIIRIVENLSEPSSTIRGNLGKDWVYLIDKYYGKMTREKYYDMYDKMKSIHYGLTDPKSFNPEEYFDARSVS